MSIEEVIAGLKNLDLTTYPEEKIRYYLNNIGAMASIAVFYHKGKCVMRARTHTENERFSKKSELSFKPQEYNTRYQRASTPKKTMFYATAIPDKIEDGELDNMRIIGVLETIPLLRDKQKSGFLKISFGKWFVQEDIKLLAIIHKDTYYHESNFTKELVDAYKVFSEEVLEELAEKSLKIQTFLAEEFAKKEIRGDYDYMISAIFTEYAVKKGFDGVIYPSVRTEGKGFNIAITPESSKKLGLYVAGECSLYKHKDNVVVGNDAIVELDGTQEEFVLEEIPNHQKECLERIGINSLDELQSYS